MWINEKLEYKKILDQKKLELEELDYKLLKNRDKKRYILIKVAPRTISTKFGTLTFNRRIYMDNTKSVFIFHVVSLFVKESLLFWK
ncbi:UPF0236 family transposase-like protein [Williamsoniiplasma lucivorax]|uniref:Uncharacterized protein n=1 Tax=Williamsoniiplasma lucivorax TaxID=209274 RepID=A0A2S5RDW5_9MOLU|nr:hypothetical protein ELUCI_v1c05810 [Williamsoniiplasma lucivorax]